MNKNWSEESLPLKGLHLWDENARFPEEYFKKSQEELIEYFLNKKDFKIKNLAEAIVNEFDLPQLEKLVVLKVDKVNITLEGNRRVAVYKLLVNPLLCKDEKIRNFFKELKNKIKINDKFLLETLVTEQREEGLRFLDRKHNKANNEVAWGEVERHNFAARRLNKTSKNVLRVELAKSVKKLSLPDNIKEDVLGKGFVTTLYRIIDSAYSRNTLEYDVHKDGNIIIKDQEKFEKLLKTIVFNVWNKKDLNGNIVDSRSLNTGPQIEKYLESITLADSVKVDKEIKKAISPDLFGKNQITKPSVNKSKPLSLDRKFLINSAFYISEARLNNIYHELKSKLIVADVPNAVAVLFRVFLEGSLDCYLDKKKIVLKNNPSHNPSLSEKLRAVANDLHLSADEMKIINKAIASKNTIYSVDTFNAYVHNVNIHPSPMELRNSWNEFAFFFEKLWASIK